MSNEELTVIVLTVPYLVFGVRRAIYIFIRDRIRVDDGISTFLFFIICLTSPIEWLFEVVGRLVFTPLNRAVDKKSEQDESFKNKRTKRT